MLRLLGLVVVLTVFLSSLLAALISLASYGISDNYALQTSNCAQPCWHGIQPGVTKVEAALANLRADPTVADLIRNDPSNVYPCELEWKMLAIPLFTGCLVIPPSRPVEMIILRYSDEQIRLGDVMAIFGRPRYAQLCYRYDFGLRFRESVFATVYFPNNIMVMAYHPVPGTWELSPLMYVKMIRYERPDAILNLPTDESLWHGFKAGEADERCNY